LMLPENGRVVSHLRVASRMSAPVWFAAPVT
jgi:hypothetical protein